MKGSLEGLTSAQVLQRVARGEVNTSPRVLTRSIPRIIADNAFTWFNAINTFLFILVLIAGEYKNGFFYFVAVTTTIMGSMHEIRAKLFIDKLAVITQTHASVIRDGQQQDIPQDGVVLDDILLLATGNQITADGIVISSEGLEVDESLLTGESNPVPKRLGEAVLSGSFVVAGRGAIEVTAVGTDSYAQMLSENAVFEKQSHSQLVGIVNFIVKSLIVVAGPLGVVLFLRTYLNTGNYSEALLAAVASTVGMLPEGLVMLMGFMLAIGVFNLVRLRTLTQSLPSIETLARVDVLCVDKTGTITDGTQMLSEIVSLGPSEDYVTEVLTQFSAVSPDDDATMRALRQAYPHQERWQTTHITPFSSARKWSAVSFAESDQGAEEKTFVLGAPEFVLKDFDDAQRARIASFALRGLRVLALAQSKNPVRDNTLEYPLEPVALIVLAATVRESARDTFLFFQDNKVEIKVMSGDDPQAAATTAALVGIARSDRFIDMSTLPDESSYEEIVDRYTVFGRTSPLQKQELIRAIKNRGKIVGMAGDGVNDVMALREAHVGVAMASGSDAARMAADFVSVDSDFSTMVGVVREGRRLVNNTEAMASLFIVKTLFSLVLAVFFIVVPVTYPYVPIHQTLLNILMGAIPTFFLMFDPNYRPMSNRFAHRLIKDAVPAAILIVANVMLLQFINVFAGLTFAQVSTLSVLINGAIRLMLIARISQPFNKLKIALNGALIAAFISAFLFAGQTFELVPVLNDLALIWVPMVVISFILFEVISKRAVRVEQWWIDRSASREQTTC